MTYSNPVELDKIFDSLAHKHRREIVYTLSLGPSSISKLAEDRNLSLPAIHKHIKILENGNLIQRKKVGRTNFLAIQRKSLRSLQAWVNQFYAYWGNDTETLENYGSFIKGGEKIE